ncbi:MAG: hypothetical protein EOM20_15545 [Spartobacteria bacterium]|nr:hypothetical protein [Spartobacteria bacterium]
MFKSKRLFLGLMVFGAMSVFGAQWLAFLENGDFERGELGWNTWGDGDTRTEYHAVFPEDGENFLRLWKRSGWYQDFSTRPGATFQLTAYVATAREDALWGDAFGEVKIEWRNKDEDDREVGNAQSVKFDVAGNQDRKIMPDEWAAIELPTAIAPPGATHCRVLLTIWTAGEEAGGGCALFDNVAMRKL